MPVDFTPRERSAFDDMSGISILRPRMLPASVSERTGTIEFQYSFRRDGRDVGSLGFLGTEELVETDGRRERIYTLDLSPGKVVEDILRFKQGIGNADRDAEFLQGLAQGLANAFAGQTSNVDDLRYVVVAHADDLARVGISVPDGSARLTDGSIVLADVFVPAH
ncbi:hypothetical protein [Stenotrophomonas nematodicola]|uniref:Uncharacterized protein n=1 Tax=Stenotrophomonas nematodicola TaxID=2656746 RepID=A0ABW7D0S7_9GAMM